MADVCEDDGVEFGLFDDVDEEDEKAAPLVDRLLLSVEEDGFRLRTLARNSFFLLYFSERSVSTYVLDGSSGWPAFAGCSSGLCAPVEWLDNSR